MRCTHLFAGFIFGLFLTIQSPVHAQTDSSIVDLNIFPNPNQGDFYITVINDTRVQAQLFSMDGQLVQNLYLESGLNYISLQVPAGIYMLVAWKNQEVDLQEKFKIVVK